MSKRETDRAMLRAFGDAARAIQEPTVLGRTGAWATAQSLRRVCLLGHNGRRQQVYRRALALAADTAFGG